MNLKIQLKKEIPSLFKLHLLVFVVNLEIKLDNGLKNMVKS